MIIEKLTEKELPPIVKAFPLSELCSEDDLKAASDLVVSEYDVGYEYHQHSYSKEGERLPRIINGSFDSLKANSKKRRSYYNYYDCTVSNLPDLITSSTKDIVNKCNICGGVKLGKLCVHGVAVFQKLLKNLGTDTYTVREGEVSYHKRLKLEQFRSYMNDVEEYRQSCDQELVEAYSFSKDLSMYKDGIVFYDVYGYLKNCITNQAAMNLARDFLAESESIMTVSVKYERYTRTNERTLNAVFYFNGYPDKFSFRASMSGGTSVTWRIDNMECDGYYLVPGAIPYKIKKGAKFSGKEFLDEYKLIALLKLWQDINSRDFLEDSTDENATAFFGKIESFCEMELDNDSSNGDSDEIKRDVELYPKIVTDYVDTTVEFKIGSTGSKSYVLKNFRNLLAAYRKKSTYSLSKTASIDFSKETFTDSSMKIFQFITKRVDSIVDVYSEVNSRSRYYDIDAKIPHKMQLSGHDLDNFYDSAVGHKVDYEDNDNNIDGVIEVGSDADIKFKLNLNTTKDARDNITGISLTGVIPKIKKGSVASYILDKNTLKKISKREEQLLAPFSSIADNSGSFHLFVGIPNLNEFYYRVLPVLLDNPFVDVSDNCEGMLDQYLKPEPVFEFFMDYSGNVISMKVQVSYEDKSYILNGNDSKNTGYHDYRQEERIIREVEKFFERPEGRKNLWEREVDDELLFNFLSSSLERLEHYGTVRGTQAFNNLKIKKPPVIKIGVSVDSNMMDITVTSAELDKKELLEVLNSYKLKKKWFRLKSGEFVDLTNNDMLEEITDFLDKIDLVPADVIQQKAKLPLFRALYLDRLMQEHESLAMSRDNTYRRLIRSFNSIRDSDYEPADELKDVLREYQKHGFKWLETVKNAGFGGILADDMGLGKTLQMISVIKSSLDSGAKDPCLVVCPASLVFNWAEELSRFTPGIRACTVAGTLSVRKQCLGDLSDKDVLITSYDLLTRDIALYKDLKFELVVIDEAQYIKNPKAGHSKAVKALNANVRFALTGTPIENRLSELWSIFDYVMPGFLYSYSDFNKKFETPITKGKDEQAIEKLKNMTSPFILRRKKADVLKNLPSKIEEVRFTKISGEQQKLYDAQVLHMKQILQMSGNSGEDKIKILAELTRIRQICCDPSLVYEGYSKESAKREACMDLIETAIDGGHRMLVFSQFTSMLELLEKELKDRNISYFKITGSTPKEKRITMVHDFNEGDTPVFLISLKAGGTGLNLVGADTVIHYDPWWNLAVQNQATDRAHRIGQTKNVTVYRLILKGTIEEKILELQKTKKDLAESILEGNNQSLMSLSSEELLDLLS